MATTAAGISAARVPNNKSAVPSPSSPRVRDASAIAAYEHYLRLPELSKLWIARDFPEWRDEPVLKPALQALEITFRLISVTLSDPRPYANHREWKRRLESLSARQIELIAHLFHDDCAGVPPIADIGSSNGVLARGRSSQSKSQSQSQSQEVWKLPGTSPVVSITSEASLLPRLAAWDKSEDVATEIQFEIETQLRRCPFTLGLGEPNLAGKHNLEYDLVVRPSELHSLKRSPMEPKNNHENQTLFTVHQILESWFFAARELLLRIEERIDGKEWEAAAGDCWILERIWKLLAEVEDLHLLMDPDDFLRLKSQLAIRANSGSEAFCFRSAALMEITSSSKDLKRRVPWILGVEVDPNGGPRVQQAAMELLHSRRRGEGEGEDSGRNQLLQGFQAIEGAVKKFFFAYRQLITAVMGSLEATGNRGGGGGGGGTSMDSLTHMFLEPPYFPSLDAAKTFLGQLWHHYQHQGSTGSVSSRFKA